MENSFIEKYGTSQEIRTLVQLFESGKLPLHAWTHEAHLTVALWYMLHNPEAQAVELIRNGIQAYNQACGIAQTPASGYHETITRFWAWVIRQYLTTADHTQPVHQLANNLLNSAYADKSFLLTYYSKEWLFSAEARASWLPPDRMPITGIASE